MIVDIVITSRTTHVGVNIVVDAIYLGVGLAKCASMSPTNIRSSSPSPSC